VDIADLGAGDTEDAVVGAGAGVAYAAVVVVDVAVVAR